MGFANGGSKVGHSRFIQGCQRTFCVVPKNSYIKLNVERHNIVSCTYDTFVGCIGKIIKCEKYRDC